MTARQPMRGSPYSTSRWQKTRAYVIARDGRCMLNGPRCNGCAQTAHHTKPSSQFPQLFFDTRFIVASCRVAHQNTRQTIENLCALVEQQDQQIKQLLEQLTQYENGHGQSAKHRAMPAIR